MISIRTFEKASGKQKREDAIRFVVAGGLRAIAKSLGLFRILTIKES
jgi:hypothetical protein